MAESSAAAEWASAFGTIAAVVVALGLAIWQDWKAYRDRPILRIGVRLCPPDCGLDATKTTFRMPFDGGVSLRSMETPTYWFRMYVRNVGRSAARNVEVTIQELTKRSGDTHFVPVPSFLLSNLGWTHRGDGETLPQLLPGTDRNFELGGFQKVTGKFEDREFRFAITVDPVSRYNLVTPGVYGFTIIAGAANCQPSSQHFRLTFDGNWSDDYGEMFERHARIDVL